MSANHATSRPGGNGRDRPNSRAGTVFEAKRTEPDSILFAILQPHTATAASVDAETIGLQFLWRSVAVPLGDVESVDVESVEMAGDLLWAAVRIRHSAGSSQVSGLSKTVATDLAESVGAARIDWWRNAIAARTGALQSVHDRLAELAAPPKYVTADALQDLVCAAETASDGLAARWPESLSDSPTVRRLCDILAFLEDPGDAQERANKEFVASELARSRQLFDRFEARPLTEEQRRAVVVDERRNLVVAAAGSGKTSVIVAKAGWLVQRGYRKPSELLLLAFARDTRYDMEERVGARLGDAIGPSLKIRTFRSLCLEIIGEAEGERPTLASVAEDDAALPKLVKGILADLLADREHSPIVREWFQGWFAPYKSEHDFKSWDEYYNYIRRHDIRSLKGDPVRSLEECEIANFLYLNGVDYRYEDRYMHDLTTWEKRRCKPDFYLPGHGVYIEHFGINAAGNTAPFVDRKKYLREMKWKRKVHAEHNAVLIETFSHERAGGTLLRNLSEKLASHGVKLAPIPRQDVFAVLNQQGRINSFARLVATFLQHFKGNGLTLSDIAERAHTQQDRARAQVFLWVFGPIFERYRETLSYAGEIDFHDMINRATDLVEAGRYRSPFRYILVDEFQDISPPRARLLKALLDNSADAQLFAVGDDWQAIFRFAGSDIDVMREFRHHFGPFERLDLQTTFRCADRIATVATDFVLRNPAQIRKKVRARRSADRTAVHIGLPGQNGASLLNEALDRIAEDARRHEGTSEVLLLGRYRHQKPQNMGVLQKQYSSLRLSWKTMHGSKGTEADYVVVLSLCSGKHGFPSEIADDPLLDLVLAAPEAHTNAEERRLLYVAITRAKRQVFLLADSRVPSEFVSELIEGDYEVAVFGRPPEADIPCPRCTKGRLVRLENKRHQSTFYSCLNYPLCRFRSRPCPKCGNGLPVKSDGAYRCRNCNGSIEACATCDGWLEVRMGKYGRFLGCSNYPDCKYTRDLGAARKGPRAPGTAQGGATSKQRRRY